MGMLWVLCVVLCYIPLSWGQTCGTFIASDGTKYNLTGLTKSSDYTGVEAANGALYYWNFCVPVKGTGGSYYGCVNAYIAKAAVVENHNGNCYVNGYIPPKFSDHPGGPKMGVRIDYINEVDQRCASSVPRTSTFFITCDPKEDFKLLVISEPQLGYPCVYWFNATSKYACAVGSRGGGGKDDVDGLGQPHHGGSIVHLGSPL